MVDSAPWNMLLNGRPIAVIDLRLSSMPELRNNRWGLRSQPFLVMSCKANGPGGPVAPFAARANRQKRSSPPFLALSAPNFGPMCCARQKVAVVKRRGKPAPAQPGPGHPPALARPHRHFILAAGIAPGSGKSHLAPEAGPGYLASNLGMTGIFRKTTHGLQPRKRNQRQGRGRGLYFSRKAKPAPPPGYPYERHPCCENARLQGAWSVAQGRCCSGTGAHSLRGDKTKAARGPRDSAPWAEGAQTEESPLV